MFSALSILHYPSATTALGLVPFASGGAKRPAGGYVLAPSCRGGRPAPPPCRGGQTGGSRGPVLSVAAGWMAEKDRPPRHGWAPGVWAAPPGARPRRLPSSWCVHCCKADNFLARALTCGFPAEKVPRSPYHSCKCVHTVLRGRACRGAGGRRHSDASTVERPASASWPMTSRPKESARPMNCVPILGRADKRSKPHIGIAPGTPPGSVPLA